MANFFEKHSTYSIRKLSVGVCSALIGLSFLASGSVEASETSMGDLSSIVLDNSRATNLAETEEVTEPAPADEQTETAELSQPASAETETAELNQLVSPEAETASPALPLPQEGTTESPTETLSEEPLIMASPAQAVKVGIHQVTAKSGGNTRPEAIVDGRADTSWQSVPSVAHNYASMYDHNRVLDVTLDGTYRLTELTLKTAVDGSFSNYYVYASEDGTNYRRIVAKTDEQVATDQGDRYQLDNITAAYIRINMAYNSGKVVTNLAELDLRGQKISDTVPTKAPIAVTDWADSDWKTKWDRFETDSDYAKETVKTQMKELVGRVIGQEWKDKFTFEFKEVPGGKDVFEIDNTSDQGIVIRANNGVAFASGFNYYLKNYAKVDFDPVFASNTKFEGVVPVEQAISKQANFDHRYALNYTTFSYTMAFWNWDEYEKFLDWSAMNGINLMLDIVGQEEVLRQTLREFNYSDEEIKDYIPGPAYYAWFYMQNLYSIGGPLPDNWFAQRVELGRRIHDRMQTYGIKPVIQGFAGQVPETFAQKNPGAVLTPKDHWPSFVRPSIIKTYLSDAERQAGKQDYFSRVAEVFYAKQRNVFGDVSRYYSTDPFHEGGNTGGLNVTNIYRTVQEKMLQADPDAIWVMQQWQGNLDEPRMRELDKSKLLALDLQTDMRHEHGLFERNGTPWVYNVLHNFGGRMGADGNLSKVAIDPLKLAKERQNMVGIGLTAEALENSPAVYGLLFDTNWSDGPININQWLDKYAERRGGAESASLKEAWKLLLETAYRDKGVYYQGAPESVINARPTDRFNSASTWGHSNIYYDKEKLDQALKLMLDNYDQFKDSEAFRFDVAELAGQVLSNGAREYYDQMIAALRDRNLDRFNRYATEFIKTIDLTDQLTATTPKFMLGTWINAARKMLPGTDDWTSDLFEANARTIITTWGTEKSGALKDYSNRKWSGLTADFYKKRWEIWIRNRQADLAGRARNASDQKAESNWYLWESRWTNLKSIDNQTTFATQPRTADLGRLAKQVLAEHATTIIRQKLNGTLITNDNIVRGKTFTTVSTAGDGQVSRLTDGVTDYSWQPKGEGRHLLEVDFEGSYRLDSINLAFPQLATQFPYDLELSIFNPVTQQWQLVKRELGRDLQANEQFTTDAIASKLRLLVSSRQTETLPVKINEIAVLGHALSEELTNLVKGVQPTTNKTNTAPDNPLSYVTDDKDNNLWKTQDWGSQAYPATLSVPVAPDAVTERVDVVFESAGRPFKFIVTVTELDGRETTVHETYREHNGTLPDRTVSVPIGRAIKGATVNFLGITGKGQFGQSGPALSELRVLGYPKAQGLTDLAYQTQPRTNKTNTDPQFPLTYITDNNDKTFWKTQDWGPQAYPAEVSISAPERSHVDHLVLNFEKIGLPFKFSVSVTEQDGTETLVYDQFKSHNGVLTAKDFIIPVGRTITSAKLTYHGITGKGEFYAAGPALAGFKLMGYEEPSTYQLADYTALNATLANLPSNLGLYTETSLTPLQDLLASISSNREAHEQAVVNGWQTEITRLVGNLVYKPADYTEVDRELARKPENRNLYTDDSWNRLTSAEQSIVRGKNITEQATVDNWANQISQAINNLVYKPADYTSVDRELARKPENSSLYTDDSWNRLASAEQSIVRGKNITEQATVDNWANQIRQAINNLVYKPADYTAVDRELARKPENRNLYTDDSWNALTRAEQGIVRGKNITEQATVDNWANQIRQAINNLVYKPADYTAVDRELARKPENSSLYTDDSWNRLTSAEQSIVRGKNITEQATVDSWANQISQAINNLVYKPADYTAVDQALANKPSDLSNYRASSLINLERAEQAVIRGKNITEQELVDGYALAIRQAIAGLERKVVTQKERREPVVIPIPVDEVRVNDDTLEQGQTIIEDGEAGEEIHVYLDTYVDDELAESGTEVVKTIPVKPAKPKRVRVGTKVVTPPTDPTTPVDPTDSTDPTTPVDPTDPTAPTRPVDPSDPTSPADPTDSTDPTSPADPSDSTDPTTPVDPTDSTDPTTPVDPTDSTDPTTPVDPTDSTDPTTPVDPTDSSDPTTPVDPTDSSDPTSPVDPTDSTDLTTPVNPSDSTDSTTPVDPTDSSDPTTPVNPTDSSDPTSPVDPSDSSNPTTPVEPTDSSDPTTPVDPTDSSDPTTPVDPTDSTDPTSPVDPSDSTDPTSPVDPTDPTAPTSPVDPTDSSDPTTPVDPTKPAVPVKPTGSSDPVAPTQPAVTPARVLKDEATGVQVALAAGEDANIVALRIVPKETGHVATPSALKGADYDLFDIELVDKDGKILKMAGRAEVSLPVDAGKEVAAVVYLPNSDKADSLPFRSGEIIDATGQRQKVVIFTAEHFSEYGIVYKPATVVSTPGTSTNASVTQPTGQTPTAATPAGSATAASKPTLPNTGEASSSLALLGGVALVAALGLTSLRKREH